MKRTTVWMGWLGIAAAGALVLWGLHWFFRVPPVTDVGESSGTITEDDLVFSGVAEQEIPSIDTPDFESVAWADQYLKDDGFGLDVEIDGEHRFYPYQILVWHEIVNDTFEEVPVAVTYNPLTDTGMAFDRRVDGEIKTFHASGLVWNNNLVMRDTPSDRLWIQILGSSLDGKTSLKRLPASVMTWETWKRAYPFGDVLSRETSVTRDYTRDPYGTYGPSPAIWFPLTRLDERLHAKERVSVVSVTPIGGGNALVAAFPTADVQRAGEVRDTVGGVPVAVVWDEDLETARAHRLSLNGELGEDLLLFESYWFAVAAAFPDIQLYQLP